jgi:hypothetical protein
MAFDEMMVQIWVEDVVRNIHVGSNTKVRTLHDASESRAVAETNHGP